MVNMKYFVYVIPTNTINLAAPTPNGTYQTDLDGERSENEIVFMLNPKSVKAAMEVGAMITPKAKAAL